MVVAPPLRGSELQYQSGLIEVNICTDTAHKSEASANFISNPSTYSVPLSRTPARPTFRAIKTTVIDSGFKASTIEFDPSTNRKHAGDVVENILRTQLMLLM